MHCSQGFGEVREPYKSVGENKNSITEAKGLGTKRAMVSCHCVGAMSRQMGPHALLNDFILSASNSIGLQVLATRLLLTSASTDQFSKQLPESSQPPLP